jgi:multiple sugar transport system substrate-binding protein
MLKKRLALILILMSVSLFCVWSTGKVESSDQKVTITYWDHQPSAEAPVAQDHLVVIKKFQQENPNITVKAEWIPFADFMVKLETAVRAGNPPDCSELNWNQVVPFALAGSLEQLDPYLKKSKVISMDSFFKPGLVGLVKDKLYALPQGTGTYQLFYNVQMFKDAGVQAPINNWNEFNQAVGKFTKPPNTWALARGMGNWGYVADDFNSWLIAAGGSLANENATAPATDTPAFRKTWMFYTDLVLKYNACPPGFMSAQSAEDHTLFAQGKVAMLKTGPWGKANIERESPNLQWDMFKIPGPETGMYGSVVAGWQYGLWKDGKQKTATWKFLEYIDTPANQATYSGRTNLPWLKDAKNFAPYTTPFYQKFFDVLPYTKFAMAAVPELDTISHALHEELQAVLLGSKSQDQGLQDLTKRIRTTLPSSR